MKNNKVIIKVGEIYPKNQKIKNFVNSPNFKKIETYYSMLNEIEMLENELKNNCENKTKKRVKDIDKK